MDIVELFFNDIDDDVFVRVMEDLGVVNPYVSSPPPKFGCEEEEKLNVIVDEGVTLRSASIDDDDRSAV